LSYFLRRDAAQINAAEMLPYKNEVGERSFRRRNTAIEHRVPNLRLRAVIAVTNSY
jgi:hypothetical protein